MTSQRSIFDEWRARLADYERESNDPAGTGSWLSRAYAKVLRFLLSFYGDQERAASKSTPSEVSAQAMDSWVAEPIGPGKPARTTEVIRHTVDSIHEANSSAVESGPLIDGLRADDLIQVGQFSDYEALDSWLLIFTQRGFAPQTEHGRDACRVKVPFKHYAEAKALLEEQRRKRRPRKLPFDPRALEYSFEQPVQRFSRFFVRLTIGAIGFPIGGTVGQLAAVGISASKETTEAMILWGAIAGLVFAYWYAGGWVNRLGE